jgi:chromosomal replication initiator protein
LSLSPAHSTLRVSAPQVWEATLGQLLLRVSRQNYETWLRNTIGIRFDATTLVVAAASDLACDWLSTRMRAVIGQALSAVTGPGINVRFEPANVSATDTSEPLQPALLPQAPTPLNPRFTFETFLCAGFNRLALTAAKELVEGSDSYSPLFITGPAGSGKTHILHSAAREAAAAGVRILLVNSEQFLSEFTSAVQNKKGAAFRARYRDVDVLLVDDVHLLVGKKATLNEFYLTLADLHDHGRRIVVAGDPCAMNGSAERFQGLLHWGLVAAIEQPSTEDRIRFIAARASSQGVCLPDDVQHYLALRVRSSIRDLEGAVNRVTALARIAREPITIDFAAKALKPVSALPNSEVSQAPPSTLIDAVCKQMGFSLSQLSSAKRDRDLTRARHLAMYLLRQDAGLSYSAIAHLLGKKDHSTVVHACSQVHKELELSPTLRADIDAVRATLTNLSSVA